MAGEAIARADGVHPPAGGLGDALRLGVQRAHGEIERPRKVIETHAALVQRALIFKDVGLPGLSASERPQQGNGETLASVAHGEDAADRCAHDGGMVRALLKSQFGMAL